MREKIGVISATVLVVANMIGTGIFTTSGFIIKEVEDPQTMLFCWLIGGIFALSGALCYGELGAMFPWVGGEYAYLRESFGKWMAFLSGWISLIVGFSAPIAAASIACASYGSQVLPPSWAQGMARPFFSHALFTVSPISLLALAIILVFSAIHSHSLHVGSKVQNALTFFKIALILGLIAAGLGFGRGSWDHFAGSPDTAVLWSAKFAASLIFISFAYSGWNAAAYLGAEIENPRRNIPLALFVGTFLVMCLYLLLNVVFIYALPVQEMAGVVEVGAKAALALFGAGSGHYLAAAIAVGLLSVISAMVLAGPRVYYAMALDRVFFQAFGRLEGKFKTPSYAIFFQGAIAMLMVLTASFEKLLFYIGFTLSLFALCTVTGLIVLRRKRPEINRPYKTWGYPVTPLVFILGNLWIIVFSVGNKPVVALYGLGTILCGSLVYLVFKRMQPAG